MSTNENGGAIKRVIVGQLENIISYYFRQSSNEDNDSEAETNRKKAYDAIEELLSTDKNKTVSGDSDDFHNLAVTFATADDYETALEIVEIGLTIHKTNTDLLADAIKYGCVCGNYSDCDEWLHKLNQITRRRWTWRAYSFSIDYLIDSIDRLDEQISDEHFEIQKKQILDLIKEYQERYYDMEDSWYSEFEMYWKLNERKRAKEILEEISKKDINCPKAWLRYADILMDDGKIEEAEKTLKLLRENDTDSSYAYYLDGRCRLSKLLKKNVFAQGLIDENIQNEVQEAYRSFSLAWKLRSSNSLQEKIRNSVHRLFLESEIRPLAQYELSAYGIKFDDFDN